MPGDAAVGDLGGTLVDGAHAHDPGSRWVAAAAGTAVGAPGAQQDPLPGQFALGQRVDPAVDGLMRHPASLLSGVFVAQPTGDLVRGVAGPQPGQHLRAQPRVGVQLAGLGPAPRAGGHPAGPAGPVAVPATVAGDLAADHARVPPDPSRDHHPGLALGKAPGDLLPLPGAQHPPSGAGPGSAGRGAQRTGLPSPVKGAYGVARDGANGAALDRRAVPVGLLGDPRVGRAVALLKP